jgi:hypothetical protein
MVLAYGILFSFSPKKKTKKKAPQFSKPLVSPREKGNNKIVTRVSCKESGKLLRDRKSQTTLNTKP